MRIFVFIFFLALTSCGPKSGDTVIPKAVNGILDLSNWDFKKNGPIQLKGEWLFFWNHFIDPVNIPKEDGLAQVPGPWTNVKLKNGENPTPTGYASYVLKVRG